MVLPSSSPASLVRTAILLAAGRGTRLGPALTDAASKVLVKVGGRTLLEHQVAAYAEVGVEHIVLVIGCGAERVVAHAAEVATRHPVRFSFVVNEAYASTNTVVSQYLARSWLAEPCFCSNGDVLFGSGLLLRLLSSPAGAALAVDVKRCGAEEVKAVVHGGRVAELGKLVDPDRALGEFVGVARYDRATGAAFAAALEVAVEEEGRQLDYFEVALDRIAPFVTLAAVPTGPEPVVEIDTPDDHARAVAEILPRLEVA